MIEQPWNESLPISLLIVDDNPDNLFVITQMLKEYIPSCSVTTTTNPLEALEIIESKKIDGVICDIQMPQMNGIEVCERIKESKRTADIPVLLMTSHRSDPGLRARGLSAGADDFISKPIDNIEFAARIKVMLRIKKSMDLLNTANLNLEEKINSRTAQLVETNKMLLSEKEKAQKYLDVAGVMIVVLDLSGTITKINKKGCEILEATEEALIGTNWFTGFLKEEDQKQQLANFKKMFDKGPRIALPYQHSIVTTSGAERILSFHNNFLTNNKGSVEEIIFSGIDITAQLEFEEEKRRLQLKLQHSQKMESIGTLAGGIAHDFNNILSAIIGYTELALEEIEKDSIASADLEEVCAAGQRAKDLVKQILAFARRSGEESSPIKPSTIAEEVIHLLRSSIPSNIAIEQQLESKATINANPTQLYQVIMNLCTNAAHAMEEKGGQLHITVSDIEADEIPADSSSQFHQKRYVRLQVVDTGKGIPQNIIDTIFEPYFTTKKVGEGTGMGLAMVQGIVETYGGTIKVTSKLGIGSTFTIYLPISDIGEREQEVESQAILSGTERILFVDDEVAIANIGYQFLHRLGYTVTMKTSSLEALELFQTNTGEFDLVISDMTMPEMTGDVLAQEINKIRPETPVILCTGYSKRLSPKVIDDLGLKGVIPKPFTKSDLGKAVRKVFDATNAPAEG